FWPPSRSVGTMLLIRRPASSVSLSPSRLQVVPPSVLFRTPTASVATTKLAALELPVPAYTTSLLTGVAPVTAAPVSSRGLMAMEEVARDLAESVNGTQWGLLASTVPALTVRQTPPFAVAA